MRFLFLSLFVLTSLSVTAQKSLPKDTFDPLFDHHWKGTLTYLDYSSNKEVAIPVEMDVMPVDDLSFKVNFTYPNEPGANNSAVVKISDDGTSLNGQEVLSVENIGGGNIEIVTTENGEDNGKPATLTYTYIIGPKIYSNEKFVHYDGEEHAFLRNSYSLKAVNQ